MTKLLGLDLGTRRTGVAFADTTSGILCALTTIHHKIPDEALEALKSIITEKKIEEVVIGLPRLLDGSEGNQARFVRTFIHKLHEEIGLPIHVVDERFTSSGRGGKEDVDASAACSILDVEVSSRINRVHTATTSGRTQDMITLQHTPEDASPDS